MNISILLNYLPLLAAWIFFGLLHSYFAQISVKKKLQNDAQRYRKWYSILSIIGLLVVFLTGAFTQTEYLLPLSKTNKTIGLIAASFGIILLRLTFKNISLRAFLGLKEDKADELNTSGLYAYVRHPLYSATVLLLIGYFFYNPTIVSLLHFILGTIYLLIGIVYEERKLIHVFKDAYKQYQQQVPYKIIPKVY